MALTRSEILVENLCKASFLSLWSVANPQGSSGKELCDVIVVCEPDVIIFSVKEIGLAATTDPVSVERWRRRAIEASAKQVYGAERRLASMTSISRLGGGPSLPLPEPARRRVHRVAVALGSAGRVEFEQGDAGKGFVHVLDDTSLGIVMSELDTVTDFVEYLRAKEQLFRDVPKLIMRGGERDLLAVYLHRGRTFPTGVGAGLEIIDGSWAELTAKDEWLRRKQEDVVSHVWDFLIEGVARDVLGPGLEHGNPSDAERSLRVMARETRFCRRVLGDAFNGFMGAAAAKRVRSRMADSPSGVRYVFLARSAGEARDFRIKELGLRCLVARRLLPKYAPVVGLATEQHVPGQGYSLDVCFVDMPVLTREEEEKFAAMQADLGYFVKPQLTNSHHDEYPGT
jgi:hypothetical protein